MNSIHPFEVFLNGFGISMQPIDVGVLCHCVAFQSRSKLISPSIANGLLIRMDGVTKEQIAESVRGLVDQGELELVEGDGFRGYRVVRYDEILESIVGFGSRIYFRRAARKSRSQKGALV